MIGSATYLLWLLKECWSPRRKPKILKMTENFLAVDKTFDLKINSNEESEITLQTFLRNKFPHLTNASLSHQFYFVHRLDFPTSGVLCIPLNKRTCQEVAQTFRQKLTRKYYLALVRGWFSVDKIDVNLLIEGCIRLYTLFIWQINSIGEDTRFSEVQKMCCDDKFFMSSSKQSRSVILVLEEGIFQNYPATKILILPITGRRHQIRVHCSHLGHTIVGDYTYSNKKDVEPLRMYLHALRLVIPNAVERFDVQTDDPFLAEKDWYSVKVINELNNDLFETFSVY